MIDETITNDKIIAQLIQATGNLELTWAEAGAGHYNKQLDIYLPNSGYMVHEDVVLDIPIDLVNELRDVVTRTQKAIEIQACNKSKASLIAKLWENNN